MTTNNLLKIGVIIGAHGIRGHVKIRVFLDNPESIFSREISDAKGQIFTLSRHSVKDMVAIAAIDGITDRNQAELLKNTELFSPDIPRKKENNKWLPRELTGLNAMLKNGKMYGTVSGVFNFGAGDIIEITLADGSSEMLPFSSKFVGEISTENKSLIVFPPDYVEAKE